MTLDEAIVRCFEVAEGNKDKINNKSHLFDSQQEMDNCARCAAEHRQLAERLMELKMLREERKRGKWIKDRYCSCCEWDKKNFDFYSGWVENYCPNCGAKMDGGEQE